MTPVVAIIPAVVMILVEKINFADAIMHPRIKNHYE